VNSGSHHLLAVGLGKHSQYRECFFLSIFREDFMLPDTPLFKFDLEVIYYCNRFWLCEICVFWDGSTQIVEMVELEDITNGWFEN